MDVESAPSSPDIRSQKSNNKIISLDPKNFDFISSHGNWLIIISIAEG